MNLYSKVAREIIENGEVELRIRLDGSLTFRELEEKLSLLLSAFSPEQIEVVSVKRLKEEEELEILEMVMDDYEGDDRCIIKKLMEVGDDEDF